MTDKVFDLVGKFLKDNKMEDLDIGRLTEDVPVDELMEMVSGKDAYVVKRSGRFEKYKEDKIARSIKNTADRADIQINTSDLNIILSDIEDVLFKSDKSSLKKTTDVKDVLLEILSREGYSKIRDAYEAYANEQN
ncbi:ATP cone domain-containing protein [uncultured Anaerococcus sp.]|uniref:ATP cone domain-containing protein n=1 Tax=uncultured Anaerococcus sp. TaxID=293428 RepID=UPI0025E50019|nr:ATP cone domain-containing protein [uncultured Anaerococcus sp.]